MADAEQMNPMKDDPELLSVERVVALIHKTSKSRRTKYPEQWAEFGVSQAAYMSELVTQRRILKWLRWQGHAEIADQIRDYFDIIETLDPPKKKKP